MYRVWAIARDGSKLAVRRDSHGWLAVVSEEVVPSLCLAGSIAAAVAAGMAAGVSVLIVDASPAETADDMEDKLDAVCDLCV